MQSEIHANRYALRFSNKLIYIFLFIISLSAAVLSIVHSERVQRAELKINTETKVEVSPVEESKKIRLWIVLFDSMTIRFFGSGQVPFIDWLATQGVSGEATACMDALSVPCLKAAFTGKDQNSLFFLFNDFLTSGQRTEGSIFELMQKQGYTIASHSTYAWKQFQHTFSWKIFQGMVVPEGYTDYVPTKGSIELMKENDFDIMITALGHLDKVSHKYGPGSEEYIMEAARSDDCVKMMFDALPEGWHFMVFGDHGHDEMGRHVPGLDIPAGYVYYGPAFKKGFQKHIDLRSHYFILSRLFSIPFTSPPPDENLEDLFTPEWISTHPVSSTKPADSDHGAVTEGDKKESRMPSELFFILLFMALGGVVFTAAFRKYSLKVTLAAGAGIVLFVWLEGFIYVWLKTQMLQQSWAYDYLIWALEFAACFTAVHLLRRREAIFSKLFLACLAYFCLTLFTGLPTVYNFGGTRFIMHGMMALSLCLAVVLLKRYSAGEKAVLRGTLLLVAVAVVLIGLNIDLRVTNFQYKYFYWSHSLFQVIPPMIPFVLSSAFFCAVIFNMRRSGLIAFLVFQAFVLAHTLVPAWVFLIALVLSVVLFMPAYLKPAFLRNVKSQWNLVAALIVMIYFSGFSLERLTEWMVMVLIGILTIRGIAKAITTEGAGNYRETLVVLAAFVVVLIGIFSFWIMFGLRIAGLDFQPVLNWFPTGWQTQLWPLIAAIMIYSYALPFLCLASVLGKYVPTAIPVLRKSWLLIGAGKILCVAVFLKAMIINNPGQFLLRDSVEDMIIWVVMSVMAIVYLFGKTRGEEPGEDPREADAG